jgi:hypothetical protein
VVPTIIPTTVLNGKVLFAIGHNVPMSISVCNFTHTMHDYGIHLILLLYDNITDVDNKNKTKEILFQFNALWLTSSILKCMTYIYNLCVPFYFLHPHIHVHFTFYIHTYMSILGTKIFVLLLCDFDNFNITCTLFVNLITTYCIKLNHFECGRLYV